MSAPEYELGRVVAGDAAAIAAAAVRMRDQPVDLERLHDGPYPFSKWHTTIGSAQSASGHATFSPRNSTLTFSPTREDGWWIRRTDQKEQFPFKVSVRNVWTTARNIVLRCGNPHNYLRMVEHIVALRVGMGVDSLLIETDSGDPPLFDRGNLDLVDPRRFATVRVVHAGRESLSNDLMGRFDFRNFMQSQAGRRIHVKTLLMDPKAIAGIGNIYACEILHAAGISPLRPAASLGESEWKKIFRQARRILRKAIAGRGTSISEWRDLYGCPGENQKELKVYGREGEDCVRCGGIKRDEVREGSGARKETQSPFFKASVIHWRMRLLGGTSPTAATLLLITSAGAPRTPSCAR